MIIPDELDKALYHNVQSIYGPYSRSDGRKHVVLWYEFKGSNITLSYPKYLVERLYGRKLIEPETVDHIDGNFSNDAYSNLRVLHRIDNASAGSKIRPRKSYPNKQCVFCGNEFYTRDNRNKYCSKSCSGKASHIK